jgi:phage gpG-like protein
MINDKSIGVELQGLELLKTRIGDMLGQCANMEPFFVQVAAIMHGEVEDNFAAGGRDPQWPESQRVKKHGGQTLIDSAQLIGSIQEFVTGESAGVSTNKIYAAAQNFGSDITQYPRSQRLYFRADKKTGVVDNRFAKKSRSNFSQWATSGTRVIHLPQREFMKMSDAGLGKIELAAGAFLTGG